MADGFLTDEQMAVLEAGSTTNNSEFISDEDMAKLEARTTPKPKPREISTWDKIKYTLAPNLNNTVQGGVGLLNTVTGNMFDEIGSGGNALIDKALGDDRAVSEIYNQYMDNVEDYQRKNRNKATTVGEIAGGFLLPMAAASKLKDAGTLTKALAGGLMGAGESAVYGVGARRGEDRFNPEAIKTDAKWGGGLGFAMPFASKGIETVADWLPDFGRRSKMASVGIKKSDLDSVDRSRSGKQYRRGGKNNRLQDAFDRVDAEGEFSVNPFNKGTHNQEKIINNLSNKISKEADDLNKIFRQGNKTLVALGEEVEPNWDRIKRTIKLAGDEGVAQEDIPKLLKKVDEIQDSWKTKVKTKNFTRANKEKKIRQQKARYNKAPSAVEMQDALVNRKVAQEYRRSILKKAKDLESRGKLSKKAKDEVERLNNKMSDYLEVRQVIEKNRNLPQKNEFSDMARNLLATGMYGGGGYLLTSALTDDPRYAILAAMLAGSRVPQVRYGLGQGFQSVGNLGQAVMKSGATQDQVRRGLLSALSDKE